MTEQPPETSQNERRKYPRIKAAIPLEFKTEGATVASRTETTDLSLTGCYLEMSFTMPVGTTLDMVLWVEEQRVPAKGIVVTHHPQFGNGIEFVDISQEDQAKLAHFLKTCEKEKPEAHASG
jgi:c-di-GMP-binding flagellar brake protein YcgR